MLLDIPVFDRVMVCVGVFFCLVLSRHLVCLCPGLKRSVGVLRACDDTLYPLYVKLNSLTARAA